MSGGKGFGATSIDAPQNTQTQSNAAITKGNSMARLQPGALDATPERLAKGDTAYVVNPAMVDSSQVPGSARRVTQSTVDRWKMSGKLDERQLVAIGHCQTLWDRIGGSHGLTIDYDKVISLPGGMGYKQQEAIEMMRSYEKQIPTPYWNCFENVCRFDEPGGVAGSRFASDDGRASQSALVCVRFVADLICQWNGY